MRILLDECAPRRLKREFADYAIRTVVEMGWSGKKNGELLKLMQKEDFTVLLTIDQNLRYQQNLAQAGVAIVVLIAATNKLVDLLSSVKNIPDTLIDCVLPHS
jgi:predicted nuclease of predicted toxin-antitoxin system